jgi:Glycosyl transferase family 2
VIDGIDLSICVPTYNRAGQVVKLVERILGTDAEGIEVVVLDNGSTDGTLSRLAALEDGRLSVHANGENRGVLFNVLNVLDKARGRYAVLLLDKDDIDPARIEAFRRFLVAQPGLACGYCAYPSDRHTGSTRFARGREALWRVGYLGHHPTGYFFDAALLRSTNYLLRFSDADFVGHFPLDFVFAELTLLGSAALYDEPLFTPESTKNAARVKSVGTNASTEDAFFSPAGRMRTAVHFAEHIRTLRIAPREQNLLVAERFVRAIADATLGYRSIMANADLCAHYHIAPRHLSTFELIGLGFRFWRQFVSRAISKHPSAGQFPATNFHRNVAAVALRGVGRRLKTRQA